jgi:hypothetical protein
MANCHQSKSCAKPTPKRDFSWLPAIIVAILPKCPFCIMAYSGAMTMCSGKMLYPNANTTASYLTIGIALLVLLSMFFNNKGRKTRVALVLASCGIVLMLIGQFYLISMVNYYLGVLLLFFGIWYNGSFSHFYHKYAKAFIKNLTT